VKVQGYWSRTVHPMTPEETQAFVDKQQATWLPVLQKISTQ
jgi:hypothetical protein